MATSAVLTPPGTDASSGSEEEKYNLYRPAGATGILPAPGSRRFSKTFVNKAKGLDSTLDGYPSHDQSAWDDWRDVYDQETWDKWVRS